MYKKDKDGICRKNIHIPPIRLSKEEKYLLEKRLALHGHPNLRKWLYGEILSIIESVDARFPLTTD